jgi:hypothetical protein
LLWGEFASVQDMKNTKKVLESIRLARPSRYHQLKDPPDLARRAVIQTNYHRRGDSLERRNVSIRIQGLHQLETLEKSKSASGLT